jgi:hypothetical protein
VATARRGPEIAPTNAPAPPIDWTMPPYARHRDGTNPIERRAVRVVELDVASMPAATVAGLAMWPESLSAWSRAERLKSSVVWATLSGSPSAPVRDALARRLGVSLRELDALVSDARATSIARRAPAERIVTASESTSRHEPPADAAPAQRRRARVRPAPPARPDPDDQLGLGF